MKKILFIIIAILAAAFTMQAEHRIFPKYPGWMKISTVYVSPMALKLGLSLDGEQTGYLKKLMKKPEEIEILHTSNKNSHATLNVDCKSLVKKLSLQLILNCADEHDKINIYIGQMLNDKEIKDILIETQEGDDYNIVFIRGTIDAQELMKMYNSGEYNPDSDSSTSGSMKKATPRSNKVE